MRHVVVLFSLLALVACNNGRGPDLVDSGHVGNDTGMPGNDAAMPGNDAGTGNPDHCYVAMMPAISTVGCNGGFVTGTPVANATWGPCTIDMANPQGSCTMAGSNCVGFSSTATMGFCYPGCTPPAMTWSSTSGCPTGSRCFPVMGGGLCFRDCDATHACPANGGMCDGDGSCS